MAKELFQGIYSSHKIVFIERIEKNLQFYLKDKIANIKKSGQEIILDIDIKNIDFVLSELKNNPEFSVEILNSIVFYPSKNANFLLLSLASMSNNFSLILKINLGVIEKNEDSELLENNKLFSDSLSSLSLKNKKYINLLNYTKTENFLIKYNEIIEEISKYYKNANNFKNNKILRQSVNDLIIKSGVLDGLDFFDLYVQAEFDLIVKAYMDLTIAEINSNDIFSAIKFTDLLTIISRLDYSAGIFPEICFCIGVEDVLQIKVSRKVSLIRMLISELFRISNHIFYIAKISKVLGADLCFNKALIEREKVLRIIELYTGSRINPNFIRIGGLKEDLSDAKLLTLKKALKEIMINIDSLETLLLDNSIITAKLKNIGIINKDVAVKYGLSGPNLRSCGIRYDVRKNRNLLLYKDISFLIPVGKYGDCLDRVQIRFNEIYQSIKIIEQILNQITDEPVKKYLRFDGVNIPRIETVASVECPHGAYKIFLELEDEYILNLVPITPSINSLFCAQEILQGSKVEDIILIIASLDLSSSEFFQRFYLW